MSGEGGRFSTIANGKRVWAVSSVCGEPSKLHIVHKGIASLYRAGDVVVYLGNIMGYGSDAIGAINEVLLFRRALIASPGADVDDVVFLRGAQEEMWRKLLQLHLAPNPSEVLEWMINNGVSSSIMAYGGRPDEGLAQAKKGAVAISRWTAELLRSQTVCDGHTDYMDNLRHAAYTEDRKLLLVNAGVDIKRPFNQQGDYFWWGYSSPFNDEKPFDGFNRVARGFAQKAKEAQLSGHYLSLDSGCGRGGKLTAVLFDEERKPIQVIEA